MQIVAFVIAFAFFVGGLVIMGYAFGSGAPGLVFFCGLIAVGLSLFIPAQILKRSDR